MELQNLRQGIDEIDHQIMELILERKDRITEVAMYKKEHHLPVFSPEREKEVLRSVAAASDHDEFGAGMALLYGMLMDLNKLYEYQVSPKEITVPTALGGASVRAILSQRPGALCRYLAPLAAAEVSINGIRSQAMPGGKLVVDLELVGETNDPNFMAVLSVLADTAEKFVLL